MSTLACPSCARGVVQAAPPPADQRDVLQANSYADLLEPIPNAVALLKAADEAKPSPSTKANIQLAQAHHHHHHHSYSREPTSASPPPPLMV